MCLIICVVSLLLPQIERRISAFMERKQMEINENNVREFCNVIDCNQGENGERPGGAGGAGGSCT